MPVPIPAGSSTTTTTATLPLHRIRFYDQTPSPITCLAFPPLPLPPARDPASHKGKNKDEGTLAIEQQQQQQLGGRRAGSGSGPDELGVLVVARENGNIELHQWGRENGDAFGNWTCVKVLPPTLTHPSVSSMTLVVRDPDHFHSKSYSVPKLEDMRLFTAGSDSTDLVERCLLTGRILSTYPIPSPPLWSMSVSPTHQLLCLATSSPSLHFLSITAHGGPLELPPPHLLRSEGLPSRTRTVSLAWGVPKAVKSDETESGWEWRDSYVITGNSDSSFRRYDLPPPLSGSSAGAGAGGAGGRVSIKSRAVVEKIGKVKGKKVNKGTIVWGVAVLPDHTIVTSDSLGSVTFWDGASMAQKQTFNAHKADGMCLIVGPSGNTVFTSGPDQRVCQFTYVPSSGRWAQTSTKRLHSHDVRALAIFPSYTPTPRPAPTSFQGDLAPVLASGGWDMSLTLTPAAAPSLQSEKLRNPLGKAYGMSRCVFEEAFTRKLGFLGGKDRISISRGARLVVGRKDRSVGVWRVLPDEQGWEKVLEMDFRLRTNLISSAISHDGQYLAVSDLYETKLFHLVPASEQGEEQALLAVRVKSFLPVLANSPITAHLQIASKGLGSSVLHFTPDSRRLIMGHVPSGNVLVVQLPQHQIQSQRKQEVEVIKAFRPAGNVIGGRVIAGAANGGGHLKLANGHTNGDMDVDEDEKEDDEGDESEVESDDDSDNEGPKVDSGDGTWISCLAASDDGQWLASSDTRGCVTVLNLDTLQVHATLPTLPVPPTQLLFPSSSPSLLLILTPSALTAYHIERRRILPATATTQLAEINTALASQYLPAQSACVDQHHHRLVVWAHDYLLTARLDLSSADPNATAAAASSGNSKKERKKRAREAREALERSTSLSLSVDSPAAGAEADTGAAAGAGVKIRGGDTFKSIIGVGWLGEGELAVVERPTSDFLGELPPVFSVASYGRS